MTRAHSNVVFMKDWGVYAMPVKQCLWLVNQEQFSMHMTQNSKNNKWLEILAGENFPLKLLWRTPTKIHWWANWRRQLRSRESSYGNVVNVATTNMYRGCHKILQLHCKRNRWREETLTVNASKSDEKISQRLKFTVKITFDAATGSNRYTICTMHVKNIFPKDSEQPDQNFIYNFHYSYIT